MSEAIEGEIIESTALATVQPQAPALFNTDDPNQVLEVASKRAKALMKVVNDQHLFAVISGKKHLTVEAWQTLAVLSGVTPFTEWCRPVEGGWEARVTVRNRAGMDIGAAEAQCTREERTWSKRDDYGLRSMAQTRATSKAIRSVLAFIAVLAGFEPTPSDEMPGTDDSGAGKAPPVVSTPVDDPNTTRKMTGEPGDGDGRIELADRAKINGLVADQILAPFEIAEVVGEVLRDGRCSIPDIQTKDEGRRVYKALKEAKVRAATEVPIS